MTAIGERTVGRGWIPIAAGTAISRATGVARVLVVPAVFGAGVVGDMFGATNALPLTLFTALGGQALTSILVPVMVRALDRDEARAHQIGRVALGWVATAALVVAVAGIVLHRAIAAALAWGLEAGGNSGAADVAAVLLLLVLPQVVLYGLISVLVALQHARRQFWLPAVAPAVENLVMVAAVAAIAWSVDDDLSGATASRTAVLVALGLGSSVAVLIQLTIQAWGAARVAMPIRPTSPRAARSLPELGEVGAQVRAGLAWTVIFGARVIALAIAAGWAGAGGVQGLQIGYIVGNLPLALIGYPIAAAMLPRLVRARPCGLVAGYVDARDMAVWLVVPIAVAMMALSDVAGEVLALGRFGRDGGAELVAAALVGLGVAGASEALYEVARQVSFAHGGLAGFRRSIRVRALLSAVGIVAAPIVFDGASLLLALGVVVSVADVAALATIDRALVHSAAGTATDWSLHRPLATGVAAGFAAWATSAFLPGPPLMRLIVGGLVLVATYAALAWRVVDRERWFGDRYQLAKSPVGAPR